MEKFRYIMRDSVDRIALVDVTTGRVKEVLSDPEHDLWNPYYSWDGKWMSFLMAIGDHLRIYVTPVENFVPAGREHWIQLTTGDYEVNHQQFSPDGNTIYFTSDRDGFSCIWAQRLNPRSKQPNGVPFAVQHFHGSQRIYAIHSEANDMEVYVARDKIVTNLNEVHSDIWMMQLGPGKP